MNKSIIFLILSCLMFTSCKEKYSKKNIAMTMVNCVDGSYYYTSQDYICGCKNNELNYAVYNVPVKVSAIYKNNTNYREYKLNQQQIEENNKLQISGNICSCNCNGTTHLVMNKSNFTCGQVCAIVCNKFHEDSVKGELAIN